jgi:uncharacterized protein (TIGR04141 family)
MKLTIRLSKPGYAVSQLLNLNHKLNGHITGWAGIPGCEVYYGSSFATPPAWISFIEEGATASLGKITTNGAVCIIFVPVSNRYMCYTFGMTIGKFVYQNFEKDFGLKVVLNTVDPMRLRSVDSKTVDTVVTNKRTQLSKENKIEDFGFEINKDLLRSVAGKPAKSSFASMVAGSDTLTINCDMSPSIILAKSKTILTNYLSVAYKTHYNWIDNIKVEKDASIIAELDQQVVDQLNLFLSSKPSIDFQLASPIILDMESINHFVIKGYRSKETFAMPDFESWITDMIAYKKTSLTLADLSNYKIDGVNDEDSVWGSWSIYDWLICEVEHKKEKYVLSDGQWYLISKAYFKTIDTAFQYILKNKKEYSKYGQTKEKTEKAYFSSYKFSPSECFLDSKLFRFYGTQNTVEVCDIYDNRRFIHVKDGGSSSKLSHLFNQGYVSAGLFLSDTNFLAHVQAELKINPTSLSSLILPPISVNYTVVYRILKSGKKFQLSFFSKIVLTEMYRKIKSMGYDFSLEWVQKVK